MYQLVKALSSGAWQVPDRDIQIQRQTETGRDSDRQRQAKIHCIAMQIVVVRVFPD